MAENEYLNNEHYPDITAAKAIQNIEADKRASELIFILKYIIRQSGFELIDRVKLYDKKTGRKYV